MLKKIILAAATFAIVCVAYQIYQLQDDVLLRDRQAISDVPPPRAASKPPVTTRPADATDLENQAFTLREAVMYRKDRQADKASDPTDTSYDFDEGTCHFCEPYEVAGSLWAI